MYSPKELEVQISLDLCYLKECKIRTLRKAGGGGAVSVIRSCYCLQDLLRLQSCDSPRQGRIINPTTAINHLHLNFSETSRRF